VRSISAGSFVTRSTEGNGRSSVASGEVTGHANDLAVRQPPRAPGPIRRTRESVRCGIISDRIVRDPSAERCHLDSVSDRDGLDGVDGKHGRTQGRVEPAIPVHVTAQPRRYPTCEHLEGAAHRVPLRTSPVHRRNARRNRAFKPASVERPPAREARRSRPPRRRRSRFRPRPYGW
jgi:hypothetical protein